jgi:hypothetical protein
VPVTYYSTVAIVHRSLQIPEPSFTELPVPFGRIRSSQLEIIVGVGEIRIDQPFQVGALDRDEDLVHSTFFPMPVVARAGKDRRLLFFLGLAGPARRFLDILPELIGVDLSAATTFLWSILDQNSLTSCRNSSAFDIDTFDIDAPLTNETPLVAERAPINCGSLYRFAHSGRNTN